MKGPSMTQMMELYRHLLRVMPRQQLKDMVKQIRKDGYPSKLQHEMLSSLGSELSYRQGGPVFHHPV